MGMSYSFMPSYGFNPGMGFNPVSWTTNLMNSTYQTAMNTPGYATGPVASTPSAPAAPHVPSAYEQEMAAFTKSLEKPAGLNPGMIQAVPAYNTTSPVQAKYYHGDQPFQSGTTFDASIANKNAPAQPWGLQEIAKPMTQAEFNAAAYGSHYKGPEPIGYRAPAATATVKAPVATPAAKPATVSAPVKTAPVAKAPTPAPAPAPAKATYPVTTYTPKVASAKPANLADYLKAASAGTAKR